MLAMGAVVSVIQGAFYAFGNRIDSFGEEEDEFERKEIIRRTKRTPVEQTIKDLGEGRGKYLCFPYISLLEANNKTGIKPPGYEERRRERIKEKYGFEIDPVKATVEGSQ